MMLPVSSSSSASAGGGAAYYHGASIVSQTQRNRADSLEQFYAQRRQSHPALEPGPPHQRNRCGKATRQQRHQHAFGEEFEIGDAVIMMRLPTLKDSACDPELHVQLLLQKMRQCQQQVDWDEPEAERAEKEVKTEALKELTEWLGGPMAAAELNDAEFGETMQKELMEIVRTNLFRVLPPSDSAHLEADPEELAGIGLGTKLAAGACLESAWPHLQLVYRLLQLLIQRIEPNREGGLARQIDGHFVDQLLALFNSEDPRDREEAKEALHSLYSRMVPMRAEIRKRIGWLLAANVFEQFPCRGMPEILEVLGDIINGFNVPLKSEHRLFFLRCILPLHKPHGYLTYFAKLAYCVALYLEKDPTLAQPTVSAILRNWPKHSSAKEILFMAELEELLCRVEPSEFRRVCVPLFRQLAKCASSQHCRVAERALQLWNNERVLALMEPQCCHLTLPIMLPALHAASKSNWNDAITSLVFKTLKRLMCLNPMLFDELVLNWENEVVKKRKRLNESEELWRKLSDTLELKKAKEEGEEEEEGDEADKAREPSAAGSGRTEEKENQQQRRAQRRGGGGGAGGRRERRSSNGGGSVNGRPKKKNGGHKSHH